MSDTATPPTPDGLPVLGNALSFSRDPVRAMDEWATLGDVVRLRLPGTAMHLVTGPAQIERILVDDHDRFAIGPAQRETFAGVEDDAVTIATGDRWKRLRRALHPAFRPDRLAGYDAAVVDATHSVLRDLEEGDRVPLHPTCRRLTARVLAAALLDVDLAGREETVMAAADALVDRASLDRPGQVLPSWVPTPTDRRFRRRVADLDDLVDEIVGAASTASAGETVVGDLLTARDRGDLRTGEVRDNLVALLLAGHESPAAGLTHAWHLVADHPDVAAELRAEYDRVVDGDHPARGDVDALDRHRAVVAEALRLYPPTLGVNRVATAPVTLGEYRFDAGAEFILPQWPVHRDDRWWDDPDAFDPDRFRDPPERPEYAYFPFSGGPRVCIGADFARRSLTLALATMIGHLRPEVDVERPLTFTPSVALRPTSDIEATVRLRA